MATQIFKFENLNLDAYVQAWSESIPQRIESVQVPRRDGVLLSDGRPNLKRVTLRGLLTNATSTGLRTAEDTLLSSLRNSTGSSPTGKLRVWDDRYLNAQLDGYDREYAPGHRGTAVKFQAVFAAATPYWLADTCSTDSRSTSSTTLTYSLTGGGTANAPPKITLTAGQNGIGAGLRFTNLMANQFLTFASSMSSGDVLVLDCENLTAVKNGTNVLAQVTGDFFSILPGSNSIKFDGTSCSSGSISTEWRNRWH